MSRYSSRKLNKFFANKAIAIPVTAILFTVFFICLRLLPASENDMRASVCHVKGITQLCLVVKSDTIVIATDSVDQQGVWINKHWWWPSGNGRILTVDPYPSINARINFAKVHDTKQWVKERIDSLEQLLERKNIEQHELQYYLKSHGVQDEGYTRIAAYATLQTLETDSLSKLLNVIKAFKEKPQLSIARKHLLRIAWYDKDGKLKEDKCHPQVSSVQQCGQPVIIRTTNRFNPWQAYAVRNTIWGTKSNKEIITATLALEDSLKPHRAILVPGKYGNPNTHDIPSLFAKDGSPVFTKKGVFIGVISKHVVKP